jgi:hypothetical protein
MRQTRLSRSPICTEFPEKLSVGILARYRLKLPHEVMEISLIELLCGA